MAFHSASEQRVADLLGESGWSLADGEQDARAVHEERVGQLVVDFALYLSGRLVAVIEVKGRLAAPEALIARMRDRMHGAMRPDEMPASYVTDGYETVFARNAQSPRQVPTILGPTELVKLLATP